MRRLLPVVVVALLLAAAAPSPSSAAVYELKREGFRITLLVRSNHLVYLRILARERCNHGRVRTREFYDRRRFPISPRGRLRYSYGYNTEYGHAETLLRAHVGAGAVKGSFIDVDEEVGSYYCATGHRGDRVLRFTARRGRR